MTTGLAAVKCLIKSGQWNIKKKKEAVYVLEKYVPACAHRIYSGLQ